MPRIEPIVYIIDDDPSVQKALGRLMRSAGVESKSYSSGEDFLSSVKVNDRGCVVLDFNMLGDSGPDVQRQMNAAGLAMPVIILSAQDDAETREYSREQGAIAFFRKPVDDQALLDTINWALRVGEGHRR